MKKIPHYSNYFLIDGFNLCTPAPLDLEDLEKFKVKCSALPKHKINEDNINESLDKLLALNMPDGGLPVDDFIELRGSYSVFIKLNNSLIDLLLHGIRPMNEKYIFHCDVKDSNILVDRTEETSELKPRLIDWGLSTYYVPLKNSLFPKTWFNRPLQFNVPFSVILLTNTFYKKYTKFLKTNKEKELSNELLKPFVLDYLYFWIKERGAGHYKFINNIMYKLFSHDITNIENEEMKRTLIETDFTVYYITNYSTNVLLHYTFFKKDGSLNLRIYLDNVFIHIIDVYGLITSYYPILNLYYDNYADLSPNEMKIFTTIKEIFIRYLYQERIVPINVNEVAEHLRRLNSLFENEQMDKESTPVSKRINTQKTLKMRQSTKTRSRRKIMPLMMSRTRYSTKKNR